MKVGYTGNKQVHHNETHATSHAKKNQHNGKTAAAGRAAGDVKAELSAKGKDFAKAKSIASSAPDVREEKIAELKRRLAAGGYHIDANAIADRMVHEHLKMR